jgi:hypothetical protein
MDGSATKTQICSTTRQSRPANKLIHEPSGSIAVPGLHHAAQYCWLRPVVLVS